MDHLAPGLLPRRRRRTAALVLFLGPLLAVADGHPAPAGRDDAPPARAGRYESRQVEGWSVLISEDLLRDEPELAEEALALLRHQLYQVVRRVPRRAVEKLRTIKIWVEEKEPNTLCMAYHPDVDWLREHGVNPDKVRSIELANVRNFLTWTREQPWMVLHELAHAYHHQVIDGGFENAEIKAAYDRAKGAGLYRSVLRINGQDDEAYALTNPMEYFAESSEAFFGTNDFYPYVSSELRRHDPKMSALLETLWGGS